MVGQKRPLPVPQQQGPPVEQRRVRAKSEERDQLANNVLQVHCSELSRPMSSGARYASPSVENAICCKSGSGPALEDIDGSCLAWMAGWCGGSPGG